jgi:hydroxymethylbilane synthase
MSVLKLGTRKSLLAWAQSGWVARQIEKHNPGTTVELVGIETQGDRILDVSLQSLAETSGGKEFFVAEIDEALRLKKVDLTVHSMKDLSLDRPAEFILAANPLRENPRDVALFGPGIMEKLRTGQKIRVGTSSPRRVENIPSFLKRALPFGKADLEFVEIRGNVNTRLSRVHEPDKSSKHLDAVILAFAGLIRLWQDEKGRAELKKLLTDVRWMVLPLLECPAAPAQGALAIECRRDDQSVLEKIRKIHSETTAAHVALERNLLAEFGGGCHQKFGATAISTANLSRLFYVRGMKPDGSHIESFDWERPSKPSAVGKIWNGIEWRAEGEKPVLKHGALPKKSAVFIAHSRAVQGADVENMRVWTSGTGSWLRLAEKGIWVEGSAENLGFESVKELLDLGEEGVLQLPHLKDWIILTHLKAVNDWAALVSPSQVVATYEVGDHYSKAARSTLVAASDVFWSSGSQFNALKGEMSPEKLRSIRHACGPGKTANVIAKELGSQPLVFPSVEEWKKWTGI